MHMNIAILASGDYFSTYGGGQVYVRNLVEHLRHRGHLVEVISIQECQAAEQPAPRIQQEAAAGVWRIDLPRYSVHQILPVDLQDQPFEALRSVLRAIRPNIVHAHGWKPLAGRVCSALHIPLVITAHHGGVICPNGMLMQADDSVCNVPVSVDNCRDCALHFVPGGRFWRPLIQRLPEPTALLLARHLKPLRNIPYTTPAFLVPLHVQQKLQLNDVLRHKANCIVAPSRAMLAALQRNGFLPDKLVHIPHGITPLIRTPLRPGLPDRPLQFGYVGRISYIKGLHVLLQALQGLPNQQGYQLHVYGEAATRQERRYLAGLMPMTEHMPIIWQGKIDHGDLQPAYESFDVLISPSICLESFGLNVVEALSAGRPVIASRCGGPEDTIQDGVNGRLVATNDPAALRTAIQQLIDQPARVQQLAQATGHVHTLDDHVRQLLELYGSLMNRRHHKVFE